MHLAHQIPFFCAATPMGNILPLPFLPPAGVIRSPLESVRVPRHRSLSAFLLQRIKEHEPGSVALVDGATGAELTYGQLGPRIVRLASGLASAGVKKGTVVALYSPNSIEYVVALLAVVHAGGIAATVNPAYTSEELAHQLADAGAELVLTSPALAATVAGVVGRVPSLEPDGIVSIGGDAPGAQSLDSLLARGSEDFRAPRVRPGRDVCLLPYSSGTTGLPKGVMLTHTNMVANACQTLGVEDFNPRVTMLGLLPLFHIYGLQIFVCSGLAAGSKIVTMPKFDPALFLKVLVEHKVTIAHLVPPLINFLAKHPAVGPAVPSLRQNLKEIFSGAAPLGGELARQAAERLQCGVRQGYGMTEMSPVSHILPRDRATLDRAGSIGVLIPNTSCRLVDESGRPVKGRGPAFPGELCIRGPQVMRGYHNNPDATSAILDRHGYLHTGDQGYVDEDGLTWIVDRVKELIKVKGFQVAPAEVEAVLQVHADVADAAVIGVPDDRSGEVPKALVVLKPGAKLTEEGVRAHVAAHLAEFKVPKIVVFVSEIPKSPSGKVLRKVLRAREAAA